MIQKREQVKISEIDPDDLKFAHIIIKGEVYFNVKWTTIEQFRALKF